MTNKIDIKGIQETLTIGNDISSNLASQKEQLNQTKKNLILLEKENKVAKIKIYSMSSVFYSLYYWFYSIFDFSNNEILDNPSKQSKNIITNDKIENKYINNDTCEVLEELKIISKNIGKELDEQNSQLDNITDFTIKENIILKKNNNKIVGI